MNILWLSTGLFKEKFGQQNYEEQLLLAIWKHKIQDSFRVILLNDNLISSAWYSRPRLRFVLCSNKFRFPSKIKFVILSLWFAFKDKPQLIICAHINFCFLLLIICELFKIRYVLITYGQDIWQIKNRFRIKVLKNARLIISVSSYTADKIRKELPELEKRIFIIPPPIDTTRFSPNKKSESLLKKYNLDGYKVALTVTRLSCHDKDKGCDKVIEAMPKVIKVFPNLKYLLVGDGGDIFRLKKLTRELGIEDYTIFTGFISAENLLDYYNLCDLFIMPSKQEGFGMVFLEALACGKPVIVGNQDGSKEALLNGKLGILVNPDEINQLEKAMVKILKGEVESHLLDTGFLRQSIIENFGLEKFQQRVSQILSYINNEI